IAALTSTRMKVQVGTSSLLQVIPQRWKPQRISARQPNLAGMSWGHGQQHPSPPPSAQAVSDSIQDLENSVWPCQKRIAQPDKKCSIPDMGSGDLRLGVVCQIRVVKHAKTMALQYPLSPIKKTQCQVKLLDAVRPLHRQVTTGLQERIPTIRYSTAHEVDSGVYPARRRWNLFSSVRDPAGEDSGGRKQLGQLGHPT